MRITQPPATFQIVSYFGTMQINPVADRQHSHAVYPRPVRRILPCNPLNRWSDYHDHPDYTIANTPPLAGRKEIDRTVYC